MSLIQFRDHTAGAAQLELQGASFSARITRLEGELWRLLIWHRPEDAHKRSWIFNPPAVQPLSCAGQDRLELAGDFPLSLALRPFQFTAGPLRALALSSDFPQQRQVVLPPAGMRHPALEASDGLPRGSGLTLSFELQPEDAFYGLGERTGFLNKRGRLWKNWTTDEFFHSPLADPLYQAHPFVLMQRAGVCWGLYLDESWFTSFDLGSSDPDSWSVHSAGPTLDLYLIPGPQPADVIARYTALTGRPQLPPLWALGVHQCRWGYPDQASVQTVAEQYSAHALPLEALWLDIDHLEGYRVFSFSSQRFPQAENLISTLAQRGLRTVVIVDPGVKCAPGYSVYEEGTALNAWIRDSQDQPLQGEVWPKPVVWPDFSRPEVQRWWGEAQQFYLRQGVAGLWIDMNEPSAFNWKDKTLPLEARQGAHSHAELHNLYGYQMAQATWEGLRRHQPERRPFVLTRSGFAGVQKYAWVWTGDNSSSWEQLEQSLPMLLNLGLSGVGLCGADIGGFSGDVSPELLVRWSWLGVFYPFMRNHAGKGSRRQEPWQFGEPWLSQIRAALEFRYQLLPYLYTLAYQHGQDGLPLLRPLWLDFPQDPACAALCDQALLGSDLLLAPALRPGQQQRAVYLPDGQWFDFWSGVCHAGSQWILTPTPAGCIPLFQRAGSALPLRSGRTPCADAHWPDLIWQVAPAPDFRGEVWSDAGDGFSAGQLWTLSGQQEGTALKTLTSVPGRLRRVGQP